MNLYKSSLLALSLILSLLVGVLAMCRAFYFFDRFHWSRHRRYLWLGAFLSAVSLVPIVAWIAWVNSHSIAINKSLLLALSLTLLSLLNSAGAQQFRKPAAGNGLTEDDERRYKNFVGELEDTPDNAAIAGGFRLFHDKSLSIDYSTSCSSCHDVPNFGGADNRRFPLGMIGNANSPNGYEGVINTPSIVNVDDGRQFHDRRAADLFAQCLLPPADKSEGGLPNIQAGLAQAAADPQYGALLTRAFGDPTFTIARYQTMVVSYVKTITATDAAVLRYYDFAAGEVKDPTALSDPAREGFDLFMENNCTACHKPPYFRDGQCHNTGLLYLANKGERGEAGQVNGGVERGTKTASLLNIGRTAPYGVKGDFKTVLDYVRYLNRGCAGELVINGVTVYGYDPLLDRSHVAPLTRGWTEDQMANLAVFMVEGFDCLDYPDEDGKAIEYSPADDRP